MQDCKHFNFEAGTKVSRITSEEEPNVVKDYLLEVIVKCKDCGLPFEFIGLPGGLSFKKPMMGAFGFEARLPIIPSTDPVEHAKILTTSSVSSFEAECKKINELGEEADNFAIRFAIWVKHDPQAQAYQEAGVTAHKLLELYKDRPYIDTNPNNQ